MHQLQRGRVDGVAAKITEEVRMLFEDDHINAGAGEQQPKHHSGGATADYTTGGSNLLRIDHFTTTVARQFARHGALSYPGMVFPCPQHPSELVAAPSRPGSAPEFLAVLSFDLLSPAIGHVFREEKCHSPVR